MIESEIRAVVFDALRKVAPEVDPASLAPGAPLRPQVDLDSIDFLHVLVDLRQRLGIDIPETDYARIATLDALVAYLAARLTAAPRAPSPG